MEDSQVYPLIHYLIARRNAFAQDSRLMIQYITQGQMNAISEVYFYIFVPVSFAPMNTYVELPVGYKLQTGIV